MTFHFGFVAAGQQYATVPFHPMVGIVDAYVAVLVYLPSMGQAA